MGLPFNLNAKGWGKKASLDPRDFAHWPHSDDYFALRVKSKGKIQACMRVLWQLMHHEKKPLFPCGTRCMLTGFQHWFDGEFTTLLSSGGN